MTRFLLRRLLTSAVLVWVVLTATFVVVHLAPGSFSDLILRPGIPPVQAERLRVHYGLDRPIAEQYGVWLAALAHGDLGLSLNRSQPVSAVLRDAFPPTLQLALAAFAIQMVLGVAIGVVSALRAGTTADKALQLFSVGLYSTPTFWLGLMAILVVSGQLRWLPSSGLASPLASSWTLLHRLTDRLEYLVLPAVTLGLPLAAYTARVLRSEMVTALRSGFILATRARGIPDSAVLRHALRNALPATLQVAGITLPAMLGGSIVVEQVFSRPGFGSLVTEAIAARDVPMLMGAATAGAVAVVLGNLVADLTLPLLDPRLRERP